MSLVATELDLLLAIRVALLLLFRSMPWRLLCATTDSRGSVGSWLAGWLSVCSHCPAGQWSLVWLMVQFTTVADPQMTNTMTAEWPSLLSFCRSLSSTNRARTLTKNFSLLPYAGKPAIIVAACCMQINCTWNHVFVWCLRMVYFVGSIRPLPCL